MTKRQRRKLDLDTKYYRIIVRDADGNVAWIIGCRPEDQALPAIPERLLAALTP